MKGIRSKLWTGMMLLVVLMLLLLWLFQIVFLEQFYKGIQLNRIIDKSEVLIEALSKSDEPRIDADLLESLESFAYINNLNLEVTDIRGNSIIQVASGSEQQSPAGFRKSIKEMASQALSGEIVNTVVEHPRFNNQFWVLALPIENGEVTGSLILSAPLEPVEETASILKQQLIYISGILLVAAFVLAYVISRHFSKPLFEISQAAKAMSKGDFSVRIRTNRNDEIGQLASDINEMGKSLGKVDELRKELIANISHELRTPLSLIKGYAETIKDVTGENPEKRQKQLGIIIDESDRLAVLIRDVLDLSQLESGVVPMEARCFDLTSKVHGISQKFKDVAGDKGIVILTDIEAETMVYSDENKIEQILYNLIGNALIHSKTSPEIMIKATHEDHHIKVEIIDSGIGIPEEELSYIWDRFYKSADSKSGQTQGTGLGLAIVRRIFEAQGIRYGVESRPGKGTTFWFELKKCTS